MPKPTLGWAVFVVQVLLLVASCWSFHRLGVRHGRDAQRVLTSRLGHGFLPAPSALLNDPADATPDDERRDLRGVCADCDAAQDGDPWAAWSREPYSAPGSTA